MSNILDIKDDVNIDGNSGNAGDQCNTTNANDDQLPSPLPDGLEPLPNQVAGHFYGVKGSKNYLLKQSNTGRVLKMIGDKRGWRESAFYQELFANNCSPQLQRLRLFVPFYRGTVTYSGAHFTSLDDVCASFRCPSVMDVKIGSITYDPEASAEKIEKETIKYPQGLQIGFRILGIRVFKEKSKEYIIKNNEFGKQVTPQTVIDGLKIYVNFDENDNERRMQLVNQILVKLYAIKDWFENENVNFLLFISSSLLFVYSSLDKQIKCDVKMIDFAHVFPNCGEAKGHLETGDETESSNRRLDENYLFGLRKIIECFENIRENL